jgi:hypothetical protein
MTHVAEVTYIEPLTEDQFFTMLEDRRDEGRLFVASIGNQDLPRIYQVLAKSWKLDGVATNQDQLADWIFGLFSNHKGMSHLYCLYPEEWDREIHDWKTFVENFRSELLDWNSYDMDYEGAITLHFVPRKTRNLSLPEH